MIGATRIGEVLMVPALTRLGDLAPAEAIAFSGLGFDFRALHAFWLLRSQPAQACVYYPMMAAGLGGAGLGALLVHQVVPDVLLAGVTALVLFTALRYPRCVRPPTRCRPAARRSRDFRPRHRQGAGGAALTPLGGLASTQAISRSGPSFGFLAWYASWPCAGSRLLSHHGW